MRSWKNRRRDGVGRRWFKGEPRWHSQWEPAVDRAQREMALPRDTVMRENRPQPLDEILRELDVQQERATDELAREEDGFWERHSLFGCDCCLDWVWVANSDRDELGLSEWDYRRWERLWESERAEFERDELDALDWFVTHCVQAI